MNRSSQTVAVRVWSQPYSIDEVTTIEGKTFQLVNLPFYLVGGLGEILKETSVSFDGSAHDSL